MDNRARSFIASVHDRPGFERKIKSLYPTDYKHRLESVDGEDYTNTVIQAMWLGWRARGVEDTFGPQLNGE